MPSPLKILALAGGGPVRRFVDPKILKSALEQMRVEREFANTIERAGVRDPMSALVAIRAQTQAGLGDAFLAQREAQQAAQQAAAPVSPSRRKFLTDTSALAARQMLPDVLPGGLGMLAKSVVNPLSELAKAQPMTAQAPIIDADLLTWMANAQKRYWEKQFLPYGNFKTRDDVTGMSDDMTDYYFGAKDFNNQLQRWLREYQKTGKLPNRFVESLNTPEEITLNYALDGIAPEVDSIDLPGTSFEWIPYEKRPFGMTSAQARELGFLRERMALPKSQQAQWMQEAGQKIMGALPKASIDQYAPGLYDQWVEFSKRKLKK